MIIIVVMERIKEVITKKRGCEMVERLKAINVKGISDRELHRLFLIPFDSWMPDEVKVFLTRVKVEYKSRDIKLRPIMDCNHAGGVR